MNAVKQVALVPVEEQPVSSLAAVIERLTLNPAVDVDKLERIIALQERIIQHQAKTAYDQAFARMQGELPVVTERGEIAVNGTVRSKYARYEDIIEAVRPVLERHGFSLRHRNHISADGKTLTITGILSHAAGHREEDEFQCPADNSGSKNEIQARGSTRSYGQRYTTISLLNIVTRGTDDDGKAAGERRPEKQPPTGYADWLTDLASAADEGTKVLMSAWNTSAPEFRKHLTSTDKNEWERLKQTAARVSSNA